MISETKSADNIAKVGLVCHHALLQKPSSLYCALTALGMYPVPL